MRTRILPNPRRDSVRELNRDVSELRIEVRALCFLFYKKPDANRCTYTLCSLRSTISISSGLVLSTTASAQFQTVVIYALEATGHTCSRSTNLRSVSIAEILASLLETMQAVPRNLWIRALHLIVSARGFQCGAKMCILLR